MSEKRFTGKMLVATNGEEFGFTIYDEDKRMSIKGVVDLLNEQSDTIEGLILDRNRQEEKLDIARRNLSKQLEKIEELEEENEQLQKELKNRSAFIVDKGLADTFTRWKNE